MMAAEDYMPDDAYLEVDAFMYANDRESRFDHLGGRALTTCNGCGTGGLEWQQVGHEWRLFDAQGDRHLCAPMAREYADEDDFEDLS